MSVYYSFGAASIALVGFLHYKGVFSKVKNWVDVRRQRVKMIMTLMENIQQVTAAVPKTSSFSVNESDMSASIIYERLGSQYILLIPYSRKHIAHMTQFTVELLRDDKEPLNITQQPGIPYLVSASDLGGSAIRIFNEDTGISHEYIGTAIPMYGEEVLDQE